MFFKFFVKRREKIIWKTQEPLEPMGKFQEKSAIYFLKCISFFVKSILIVSLLFKEIIPKILIIEILKPEFVLRFIMRRKFPKKNKKCLHIENYHKI